MLLLEKLNKFNTHYQSLIALKTEIEALVSDSNLKVKMQNSFDDLKRDLENSLDSTLERISNETLKATMQNALNKVNEILIQNLDETASKVALNLNLDSISKVVSRDFLEQNQNNFEKVLCEALGKDTRIQEVITQKKQEISDAAQDFLNLLSKIDAIDQFQSLTQDFLEKNKAEVLNLSDKRPILEYIKTSQELKELIKFASKEATAEIVSYESIQETIIEALKSKGEEVFKEVADLQSLKEMRFEAALHLQAIALQSELHNISKAYNALADVLIAKKRLEMLEKLPENGNYHKSFAVI